MSTWRSSRRTRPARCGWSARRIRSRPGDRFLLTFDNHNSVNGIREFARARGAETTYVPSVAPDLRVDERLLPPLPDRDDRRSPQPVRLSRRSRTSPASSTRSNGSSEAHDARLGRAARRRGVRADQPARPRALAPGLRRAVVLQDVRLPDRRRLPDRAPRRAGQARAAVVLRRHDRRGVRAARVLRLRARRRALRGRHRQLPQPARPSRSACASSTGSASTRSTRASARSAPGCSTGSRSLRHTDGSPATTIYGPRPWERRGATIAFNFLHPDGRVVDERYVDRVAGRHNISLRTGCFCNPGAGEVAFTISRETLVGGEFGHGMILDDYMRAIGLASGGAIRASLGLASNFADVHALPGLRRRVRRPHRHTRRPARAPRLLSLYRRAAVGSGCSIGRPRLPRPTLAHVQSTTSATGWRPEAGAADGTPWRRRVRRRHDPPLRR